MNAGLPLVSRCVWKEVGSAHKLPRPLLAQGNRHRGAQAGSRNSPLLQVRGGRLTALGGRPWLSNLAEPGCEQAGIDGARSLERFDVDGDIDQRIEATDRVHVARFGPLNAQILGLAIDALAYPVRWR